MSENLTLRWHSPGPVSSAFMRVERDAEILNGPIGAGKTRTAFTKAIKRAARQKPSSRDGIRKFKLCTVHANYRQLWRSTLPSWFKLMPREEGEFIGAQDGPAKHVITFGLPDGTYVQFQNDFIAIGDNAAEDVMRGYEPTAFFLNELDLLAEDVYTFSRGRVGRYPDMSEGGPDWFGVLGDCNAPELNSWLYQNVFLNKPITKDDGTQERFTDYGVLLRQPSGLSPQAENLPNLPKGYYEKQRRGQPAWYVARMIENKPGYSRAGKPVYPEFADDRHVAAQPLEPIEGLPLLIGLDAGGSPAGVIGQRLRNGQWRIIDELVSEQGTGPTRFGEGLARRLAERYPGWREIRAWADPSAQYGADRQRDEQDWIEIIASVTGLSIVPGPTNNLTPRWDAVRRPLMRLIDGQPSFLLSPECVVLREGFNSGYRFRKQQIGETVRYSEEAEKNEYSHPHDALQYLMSGGGEDLEIRGRTEDLRRASSQPAVHDWDPFNPP